jgi:hypothetical protein
VRAIIALMGGAAYLTYKGLLGGVTAQTLSGKSNSRLVGNPYLIWCDPVNIFESLVWFLYLSFRRQGQQPPWQVMATIDQADIRGSEPHNHDPSGAASD